MATVVPMNTCVYYDRDLPAERIRHAADSQSRTTVTQLLEVGSWSKSKQTTPVTLPDTVENKLATTTKVKYAYGLTNARANSSLLAPRCVL